VNPIVILTRRSPIPSVLSLFQRTKVIPQNITASLEEIRVGR